MKSNHPLTMMAILFLLFAAVSSAVLWSDVSSAVKIGFFAIGYGSGIPIGVLISRRQH